MKLPTPAEMAALERRAEDAHGISVAALMERAGARTAEVARRLLGQRGGSRIAVIAGRGNNGGDGLVAARHLSGDAHVAVLLAADPGELQSDPAAHLRALSDRRIRVEPAAPLSDADLHQRLAGADLVIDAVFGTGFHGPAEGVPARVIDAANRSGTPILAVDVPSGIDALTGSADPPCIQAVATVTMGLPKVGLMQHPAASHAGRVYAADIGFPPALVAEAPIPTTLATAAWVDRTVPSRPPSAHKGTFGHVLVVAGARGYAGAAVLTARGAIRAGAGLVTVALPASLAAVPTASLPEAMTRPLPETPAGTAGEAALDVVLEAAGQATVVAIGPGLTTHPEVRALVRRLLPRLDRPIVVDADGLNVLAGDAQVLRDVPGPPIITPHPGELARLTGTTIPEIQRDRVAAARAAARALGAVVVLKGARTVIAAADGRVTVIPTGNAAMATGGMGDVLTGAVAALLGQRLPAYEAAACAAYLHGLAGDTEAAGRGELGLLAHEVADAIPRALARVRAGTVDDGVTVLA